MNISIQLKSILARLLYFSGTTNILLRYNSINKYLILNYHRVISFKESETRVQSGMYVEPEKFMMQIKYLKKNFNIIPISKIFKEINKYSFASCYKPICILTFDDGWYDFYKYAFPILLKYEVPATVFLPTKFIGTDKTFWTDRLTKLFMEKESKILKKDQRIENTIVRQLINIKGSLDSKIENAIQILKNYREDEIYNIINEMIDMYDVSIDLKERVFLNWEEVRNMVKTGIVNIGSHTVNHRILNFLDKEEIFYELIESKNNLIEQDVVDSSFIPFCYPNGNYNEMVLGLVKNAGYHVAVTTENKWNNLEVPFFKLKRVAVHQDISSSKPMYSCIVNNIF